MKKKIDSNILEAIKETKKINQISFLSPYMMAITLESIKRTLAKKQISFNCFTLTHNREHTQYPQTELTDFLSRLEKSKSHLPDGTRFQFVCCIGEHWLAGDCRVTLTHGEHGTEKHLEFFLIDAIGDDYTIPLAIETCCPNSNVTFCSGGLQHDSVSCSFFAIDHATSLAKIAPYAQLKQSFKLHEKELEALQTDYFNSALDNIEEDPSILGDLDQNRAETILSNVKVIEPRYLPKEMGSLIKNIQSLEKFNKFFLNQGFRRTNKGSLDYYIFMHSRITDIGIENAKERNMAMFDKKRKIIQIVTQAIEKKSISYWKKIIQNRLGHHFFTPMVAETKPSKKKRNSQCKPQESNLQVTAINNHFNFFMPFFGFGRLADQLGQNFEKQHDPLAEEKMYGAFYNQMCPGFENPSIGIDGSYLAEQQSNLEIDEENQPRNDQFFSSQGNSGWRKKMGAQSTWGDLSAAIKISTSQDNQSLLLPVSAFLEFENNEQEDKKSECNKF